MARDSESFGEPPLNSLCAAIFVADSGDCVCPGCCVSTLFAEKSGCVL